MTSQEKTDNAELIEQAKALGIKGWHLCSPEVLQEKVDNAEPPVVRDAPVAPVRKVAPKMPVKNRGEDTRERLARQYRMAEPENEFVYQSASMTDAQLEAKGFQRTGDSVGGDILCRTDKVAFNEVRAARKEEALEIASAIEKDNEGGQLVRRCTESPKR